ncbi:hypothetical protein LT318_00816 [Spiroplasma sp. JKS002670]|nr:hypothetical protein [Spiroplasma sp. JKS002670]
MGIFVKALTKRGTSAYLTFDQINAKQDQTDTTLTTTDQTVVGAINELVTNKQDILVDTGDTQNIKTINGTSLLGTGDIEISVDGSSPLEDNIEIYDNEDNNFVQYKTTNLDWTAASDETLTSKSYVDQQDTTITNSISTKADTTYVDSQDALKQNITDNTLNTDDKTVVGAINELSGTKTSFTYVDSQISTKQNQNDSTLNTTSKTIVGAINENLTSIGTKQDTLTDSGDNQNIKTINSQSILGTGDITIEGGSGSTDLDNNIEIYDNEDNNFVQYKVTNPDWTAASDETLTSKSYVDTQDALKQNQTDTNLTTTSQTIVGAINEVNTNTNTKINAFSGSLTLDPSAFYKNNGNQISVLAIGKTGLANDQHFTWDKINAKQDQTDTTLTTTDQTVVGAINELVTNKQDTLVDSGDTQNIKTINSQSLLGSGDLIISAYIPGEYKYMPLSVTTMPDGWVKYNHVANRPILLSHFLSDFPTAVSNPSFDIGTNNDYQISWIPTSTLGALNFTDNTSDPATSYGFALVKSQLWQYDPDGSFSAERAEEEKLLLNEFKNKNINI